MVVSLSESPITIGGQMINELVQININCIKRLRTDIIFHSRYQKHLWSSSVQRDRVTEAIRNLFMHSVQDIPINGELFIETFNANISEADTNDLHIKGLHAGSYIGVTVTVKERDTGEGSDCYCLSVRGTEGGFKLLPLYSMLRGIGGAMDVNYGSESTITFRIFVPASNNLIATGQGGKSRVDLDLLDSDNSELPALSSGQAAHPQEIRL